MFSSDNVLVHTCSKVGRDPSNAYSFSDGATGRSLHANNGVAQRLHIGVDPSQKYLQLTVVDVLKQARAGRVNYVYLHQHESHAIGWHYHSG